MRIREMIRKIIYKEKASSQAYISYMRNKEAKISARWMSRTI